MARVVWTTAVALLGAVPLSAQTIEAPLEGAILVAFGPSGEDSFPGGLEASRDLATRLGYTLWVIEGEPPRRLLRVSEVSGEYYQNTHIPSGVAVGYVLVPAGGTPETVRGAAGPMALRWRIWLAESPASSRYYLRLWPIILGVLLIAGLTTRRTPAESSEWMRTTLWATSAAAVAYLPLLLGHAADPYNNVLGRDVVASLVIAVGLPLGTGLIGWQLIRHDMHPVVRVVLPLSIALPLLAVSPFAILLVHCTSGDCL